MRTTFLCVTSRASSSSRLNRCSSSAAAPDRQLRPDHLERHGHAEFGVPRLVDRAHAADAELPDDPVARAERLAGNEHAFAAGRASAGGHRALWEKRLVRVRPDGRRNVVGLDGLAAPAWTVASPSPVRTVRPSSSVPGGPPAGIAVLHAMQDGPAESAPQMGQRMCWGSVGRIMSQRTAPHKALLASSRSPACTN